MDREILEQYIDAVGLAETLQDLAMICDEKAEHLRVNWQDKNAANTWSRAAVKLDAISERIEI